MKTINLKRKKFFLKKLIENFFTNFLVSLNIQRDLRNENKENFKKSAERIFYYFIFIIKNITYKNNNNK